ncbi:MAG TPA: helix-turn-helix domain-containing protein [Phycisphaerae bacterium]|nr:helix-turn-helix domain-containing protein [Phycisphaerae bacterium]HNU46810.1 helix-turn-helix domain-containing protein [Phycisphaerae bacterium]
MRARGDHERQGGAAAGAELLTVKETAALLSCSSRHVERLAGSGRMPQAVRLGCLRRWRRSELADWLADGCPARADA